MRTIIFFQISLSVLLLISVDTKAQFKMNSPKQLANITLPKSAYFEPAIKDFSLLNNIKKTLKLPPVNKFKKSPSLTPSSNAYTFDFNLKKTTSRKSMVDNMICSIPNKQIKYHIDIFDPTTASNYYVDNMPNALPKVDLMK